MESPPVFPVMPFALDRNFGRACNETLATLPAGSWAAIIDHDCMFTTPHWFAQMHEAIAAVPDAGAFAVVTNRIAAPWQKAAEGVIAGDDIHAHRKIGEARRHSHRTLLDITETKGFGGVVTLLSRDAWAQTPGYADGLFCIDHSIFFRLKDAGRRVYLIEGLYVYHLRASSSKPGPQVPKWADCPCRGVERMPTSRIALR